MTEIHVFWFWRARGPRSRSPQTSCLVRAASQEAIFLAAPHRGGGRGLSGASFIRPVIPCMRAPPSWSNHSQRSHVNLWTHKHSDHNSHIAINKEKNIFKYKREKAFSFRALLG
jgi:hypothetical protein